MKAENQVRVREAKDLVWRAHTLLHLIVTEEAVNPADVTPLEARMTVSEMLRLISRNFQLNRVTFETSEGTYVITVASPSDA